MPTASVSLRSPAPNRVRVQSEEVGPRVLLTVVIAVAALLLSMVACASTSSAPGSVSSPTSSPLRLTPVATQDSARAQGDSGGAGEQASAEQLDCMGQDFIEKLRADYAANPIRAKEAYVGQRVCLKGAISSFTTGERGNGINATIGESTVSFWFGYSGWGGWADSHLSHADTQDMGLTWNEWLRARNVGDAVEAECKIYSVAASQRTPGRPVFTDCKRVVRGIVWVPTPVPTSTPFPCTVVDFGDPRRAWLSIDCSAGKVTVGVANALGEFEGFQTLSAEGSPFVSFQFIYADGRGVENVDGGYWKQRIGEPLDERGLSLMWEAPLSVAAFIMSEWRHHDTEELAIFVNGTCCNLDLYFDMTQPSAPARTFWAATPAPVPTPAPTPVPTPMSTMAPTSTAHVYKALSNTPAVSVRYRE